MMRHEARFAGAHGAPLYMQAWLPEGSARGHLGIVHGIAEHSGRYANLVQSGVEEGYGVWGFDLRGHGRSPGTPGHIGSWSEYLQDLQAFLKSIAARAPGVPRFLYGHSLGALIVLDFVQAARADLAGAILSGTPIEPAGVARPHLVALARLLSRAWPTFALSPGLKGSQLSRDPIAAAAYDSDPWVHRVATARWGTECLAAVKRVKSQPQEIRLPVLFVHGSHDPLNLASGTKAFFQRIPSQNKQLRVYPDSMHEPHNDLDGAQVARDVFTWMSTHLA